MDIGYDGGEMSEDSCFVPDENIYIRKQMTKYEEVKKVIMQDSYKNRRGILKKVKIK